MYTRDQVTFASALVAKIMELGGEKTPSTWNAELSQHVGAATQVTGIQGNDERRRFSEELTELVNQRIRC